MLLCIMTIKNSYFVFIMTPEAHVYQVIIAACDTHVRHVGADERCQALADEYGQADVA